MLERNLRSSVENRNEVQEAHVLIEEMFSKGVRPIVTIPKKYEHALSAGLLAHTTWIPDLEVVAGTMGIQPYLPGDEERTIVRVNPESVDCIHPRLTGPDRSFHGVVTITGPIPRENLEIIDRNAAYA